METLGDINPAFSDHKYVCKYCDFYTSKKSHYTDHLSTLKHQNSLIGDAKLTKPAAFRPHGKYVCSGCNKNYNSRNGLWKHKKKCNILENDNEIESDDDEIEDEEIPVEEEIVEDELLEDDEEYEEEDEYEDDDVDYE